MTLESDSCLIKNSAKIVNPCKLSVNLFAKFSVESESPDFVVGLSCSPRPLIQPYLRKFSSIKIIKEDFATKNLSFYDDEDHLK